MNGKDIIGYLVKLLEEQEEIKITYVLGGLENDDSRVETLRRTERSNLSICS